VLREVLPAEALVNDKDREPIELLLSLGFLLFVMVDRCPHRNRRPATRCAPGGLAQVGRRAYPCG
jgi:hypothetical protein